MAPLTNGCDMCLLRRLEDKSFQYFVPFRSAAADEAKAEKAAAEAALAAATLRVKNLRISKEAAKSNTDKAVLKGVLKGFREQLSLATREMDRKHAQVQVAAMKARAPKAQREVITKSLGRVASSLVQDDIVYGLGADYSPPVIFVATSASLTGHMTKRQFYHLPGLTGPQLSQFKRLARCAVDTPGSLSSLMPPSAPGAASSAQQLTARDFCSRLLMNGDLAKLLECSDPIQANLFLLGRVDAFYPVRNHVMCIMNPLPEDYRFAIHVLPMLYVLFRTRAFVMMYFLFYLFSFFRWRRRAQMLPRLRTFWAMRRPIPQARKKARTAMAVMRPPSQAAVGPALRARPGRARLPEGMQLVIRLPIHPVVRHPKKNAPPLPPPAPPPLRPPPSPLPLPPPPQQQPRQRQQPLESLRPGLRWDPSTPGSSFPPLASPLLAPPAWKRLAPRTWKRRSRKKSALWSVLSGGP